MGLLDWLTDGSLGSGDLSGAPIAPQGMPPVQMTGTDAPPLVPPQPFGAGGPGGGPPNPGGDMGGPAPSPLPLPASPPTPDPTPAAGPPDPPIPPGGPQGGSITGPPPTGGPQAPIPVPPPAPAIPAAVPAGPAPPPGPPISLAPTAPGPSAPPVAPYQLGDQTGLGRALGINPKSQSFNTALTGFGAGLTAAGNSKGKSPFQALTSGAGASIEGASKEEHAANKDAQGYLTAAINAKKAGDDATYKTNYTAYLVAKQHAEEKAAANKDAAGNKNDSPTQLYLSAQRLVQPDRNAMNKQIQQMQKDGADPATIAKTQASLQAQIDANLASHYATLGIHPQTAAQIAQQPGNSQANPINGKAAGITPDNITSKLQPGQYYTNPSNGQLFIYKGEPTTSKPSAKPSNPEPAEPIKDDKAAPKATADEDDD